jgi:CRP/FNR family cyclic AMP-dependent transcriptional regulator
MHRHFNQGDILFRQGDPSDCVLRIDRGSVEILREAGDISIVLGSVFAGQFVGEMGVIEKRPRSATARATTEVEAEQFNVPEFFRRVSADPTMAHELMLRLSERLREIEDKVADDLPRAHATTNDDHRGMVSKADVDEPPVRSVSTELQLATPTELHLSADTNGLRRRMGVRPIKVDQFPFVVGRKSLPGEKAPRRVPDLALDDRQPFRLSRQHFVISRSPNGFVIRDLNSALGTAVNGQPIGSDFRSDVAELKRGQNEIIAGGFGSDFVFRALVR